MRPGNIKAHTTVIQIGDNPFPVTAEPGLLPHPAFEDLAAADGNGRDLFPAFVQDSHAPFRRTWPSVGSDLPRDDFGRCPGLFLVTAVHA